VKIEVQHSDNARKMREFYGDDTAVDMFDDNMSAWDEDVWRDNWERMLVDIADGKFRAVIGWHADRFSRQPLQIEQLWRAAKRGRCAVWTFSQGLITDPTMLRIEAALAARDSDIKSEKITRRHQMIADDGGFHGGKRRYGYSSDMKSLDEDEAAVIRDMARRVLRGEKLKSIARTLTAEGTKTAAGSDWTGSNIGRLLRSVHLSGRRIHRGDELRRATWPAVLDDVTHANVLALLDKPERKTSTSNARVYLLAGLATCLACGEKLRGRPGRDGGAPVYNCATGRHCYRAVELVDARVEARIVDRLSRMDARGVLIDDAAKDDLRALEVEATQIEKRLEDVTDQHARGEISDKQLARSTKALERQETRNVKALAEARAALSAPDRVLEDMTGEGAAEAWESATLERRRRIIDYLCETIALRGAEGRRGKFDPSDVIVEFRKR